jgi:glutathione S-transferase
MTQSLRVFTFGPQWGLPTAGPFGLKLEMCLRMANTAYERVIEDDLRKGPKRKSPWIEQGELRMGDTALILAHLGLDLDAGLTARERGQGLALRRLLEEHWHQVLEYELFIHPAGRAARSEEFRASMKAPAAWVVGHVLHRHFRRHLFERGLLRHGEREIQALAEADIDAVSAWLEGRQWAIADRPTLTDATVFGLLAVPLWTTQPTPAFAYARGQRVLVDYTERVRARFFPEAAPSPVARALLAA